MRTALALVITLSLAVTGGLAGCIDTPATLPDDVDVASTEAIQASLTALLRDVPCEADSVSNAATSNNLLDVGAALFPDDDLGEVDVFGDLMIVALHSGGGVGLVDIRDPQNPQTLSTFLIEGSNGADVKWTSDGAYALVGGSSGRIDLVDFSDPVEPVLANSFIFADNGLSGQAHMLTVGVVDGVEYIFVATQVDLQPLLILKRDGTQLTLAGTWGATPVIASGPLGNHDMTFVIDEMRDDAPTLYVADGTNGWHVLDLTDPAKPTRIGGAVTAAADYTHTVRVTFQDGKRLVVTMSEVGDNKLRIWDASDLMLPILLAEWQADRTNPQAPQHNIQIVGNHLFMAHYTNGFFVFDIADMGGAMPVAGSLELTPSAHWSVPEAGQADVLGFANIWDIVVINGVIWTSDMQTGLHSVGFGCLSPGDVTLTAGQ